MNNQHLNVVVDYLTHNGIVATPWRFIVRREFVIEHNLFFEPDISHEDLEWGFQGPYVQQVRFGSIKPLFMSIG